MYGMAYDSAHEVDPNFADEERQPQNWDLCFCSADPWGLGPRGPPTALRAPGSWLSTKRTEGPFCVPRSRGWRAGCFFGGQGVIMHVEGNTSIQSFALLPWRALLVVSRRASFFRVVGGRRCFRPTSRGEVGTHPAPRKVFVAAFFAATFWKGVDGERLHTRTRELSGGARGI